MKTAKKKAYVRIQESYDREVSKPKPVAIVEEPQVTQFDLLPEPYQQVCVDGALPLEYVGEHWESLLVITNAAIYESGFINGRQLHRKWESTELQRLGLGTIKNMRGGYLPIACPNGQYLAIKILDEAL